MKELKKHIEELTAQVSTLSPNFLFTLFLMCYMPVLALCIGVFDLDNFLLFFFLECIGLISLSTLWALIIGLRNGRLSQAFIHTLWAMTVYLFPLGVIWFIIIGSLPGWHINVDYLPLFMKHLDWQHVLFLCLIAGGYIWNNFYLLTYKDKATHLVPHYMPLYQGAGVPAVFIIAVVFSAIFLPEGRTPENREIFVIIYILSFCTFYFFFEIWYFLRVKIKTQAWKKEDAGIL